MFPDFLQDIAEYSLTPVIARRDSDILIINRIRLQIIAGGQCIFRHFQNDLQSSILGKLGITSRDLGSFLSQARSPSLREVS